MRLCCCYNVIRHYSSTLSVINNHTSLYDWMALSGSRFSLQSLIIVSTFQNQHDTYVNKLQKGRRTRFALASDSHVECWS